MTAPTALRQNGYGAYGLYLSGLESASQLLMRAPASWPRLCVQRVSAESAIERAVVEDDWAEYRTMDGVGGVRVDREPMTARFTAPGGISDHAMIHPGLGILSAIANRWLDRDAFHAGAFLTDHGAWGVLGAKEAGKSSLLGHLFAAGVGIVCDDVLTVEAGTALAGPRCVDLREGAAARLGLGEDIGVVGLRRRWRVRVGDVPHAVPLVGWIVPSWGAEVDIAPVPAANRLPMLYANLALTRVPRRPERLLGLAALPFLGFRRPRRWDAMDAAAGQLWEHIHALAPGRVGPADRRPAAPSHAGSA